MRLYDDECNKIGPSAMPKTILKMNSICKTHIRHACNQVYFGSGRSVTDCATVMCDEKISEYDVKTVSAIEAVALLSPVLIAHEIYTPTRCCAR